jgi:hypothetical protein
MTRYAVILKEEDIPEKHKKMRDNAWKVIKDMVAWNQKFFSLISEGRQFVRLLRIHNISELWVFEYLKRYWKRGKTPNALIPDYRNCGGKGKERKAGNAKRGRPRKYQDINGEGVNVTEDIKRIFRIAVNKYYYTQQKTLLR